MLITRRALVVDPWSWQDSSSVTLLQGSYTKPQHSAYRYVQQTIPVAVSVPPGSAQTNREADNCFRNQPSCKQIYHHCNQKALKLTLTWQAFQASSQQIGDEFYYSSIWTQIFQAALSSQNLRTKFRLLFLVSSRHGSLNIGLKRMKVKPSPSMPWRL